MFVCLYVCMYVCVEEQTVQCMRSDTAALQGATDAAKIRLCLERGGFPLSGAQKSTKS